GSNFGSIDRPCTRNAKPLLDRLGGLGASPITSSIVTASVLDQLPAATQLNTGTILGVLTILAPVVPTGAGLLLSVTPFCISLIFCINSLGVGFSISPSPVSTQSK